MQAAIEDLTEEDLMKYNNLWVPTGIGDILWIYMKIWSVDTSFNLVVPTSHIATNCNDKKGIYQRANPVVDLIPQVESIRYVPISFWCDYSAYKMSANSIWLQANKHLEDGNRIETLWPSLPTNFSPELNIPSTDKKYDVVLYTASVASSTAWHGWQPSQWDDLIFLLGDNCSICIVGADWDKDFAILLENEVGDRVDYIIGSPLPEVLSVIRSSKVLVGYPSGIPILSTILGVPTLMFYPSALKKMPYTWVSPENKNHHSVMYDDVKSMPEYVAEWVSMYL